MTKEELKDAFYNLHKRIREAKEQGKIEEAEKLQQELDNLFQQKATDN